MTEPRRQSMASLRAGMASGTAPPSASVGADASWRSRRAAAGRAMYPRPLRGGVGQSCRHFSLEPLAWHSDGWKGCSPHFPSELRIAVAPKVKVDRVGPTGTGIVASDTVY